MKLINSLKKKLHSINIKAIFPALLFRVPKDIPTSKNTNPVADEPVPDDISIENTQTVSPPTNFIRKKAKWSNVKKAIVFGSLGLFIVLLAGAALYIYSVLNDLMSQFMSAAQQAFANPPESADLPETESEVLPSPDIPEDDPSELESELDPEETSPEDYTTPETSEVISEEEPDSADTAPPQDAADPALTLNDMRTLENYINIMLIGVDYSPERDTWKGKHDYHSDVMILLSINKSKNEIHLISLPRDTYVQVPGVKGIYKLNTSINCGGGWPTEEGFNKVCQTAEWLLGGIPVKYYCAVDMAAVKELVDAIGGVDYKVDINFSIMGRSYRRGNQHMDGQAVLDYFRVRKNLGNESGDLNRIIRQKELLTAIFEKLKSSDIVSKLPEVLSSCDGDFYTNLTWAQTLALVSYASKTNTNKILLHDMAGSFDNLYGYSFVFTNQSKRIKIIRSVFGIKVKPLKNDDPNAAKRLWKGSWAKTNQIDVDFR